MHPYLYLCPDPYRYHTVGPRHGRGSFKLLVGGAQDRLCTLPLEVGGVHFYGLRVCICVHACQGSEGGGGGWGGAV